MAAKKPKKKTPASPPYNPLASPYATQADFNKAVQTTARSQIDPQLGELTYQGKQAQSAHTNRNNEMGGWYTAESDAAKAAQNSLAQANQGILNSLTGAGQDVQSGMAAAIRAQQEGAQQEASRLGGVARAVDPNLLTAMAGYGGAGNMALSGDIAGSNARAAAEVGITGTAARQAAQAEDRRFTGIQQGIGDQRRSLFAQLPGLMEQARQNLSTTELGRAGQSFQQGLARDQFGLQARAQTDSEKNSARTRSSSRAQDDLAQQTFGEQKRAQRVSENQKDTELGISQQNADTQRAQVIAAAGDNSDIAAAKGKQFDSGLKILQGVLGQSKNDVVYKRDQYGTVTKEVDVKATQKNIEARTRGKFDQTLNSIMASTGMGEGTALRVMMAGSNAGWAKNAAHRLDQLKRGRKAIRNAANSGAGQHPNEGQHAPIVP
jgi:hypothetical protein